MSTHGQYCENQLLQCLVPVSSCTIKLDMYITWSTFACISHLQVQYMEAAPTLDSLATRAIMHGPPAPARGPGLHGQAPGALQTEPCSMVAQSGDLSQTIYQPINELKAIIIVLCVCSHDMCNRALHCLLHVLQTHSVYYIYIIVLVHVYIHVHVPCVYVHMHVACTDIIVTCTACMLNLVAKLEPCATNVPNDVCTCATCMYRPLQEEADRRIAETISANDLGDPTLQANLQNNLSS